MKLRIHTFELPLKHTFRISRYARTHQHTLIVELQDGELSGYGEATTNPYYNTTLENMTAQLEGLREKIENYPLQDAKAFWQYLYPALKDQPFVLCAIDQAAHDLVARKAGKPLHQYWGLSLDHLPMSNYTIGIASVEEMIAKMQEQPWPLYKIKLGTEDDLAIIKALRKHTNASFRIDANCAWTAQQTIDLSHELKALGVEFIEQPLPADQWDAMLEVVTHSALPVIADESCRAESDVMRCVGHFHGVNIKLMKCGGLTPALRMIETAKASGLSVMVGCMTESTVGISAIAQLLPLLDYVDMDGAMLLKEDIATGVRLEAGRAIFPDKSGTGVKLLK